MPEQIGFRRNMGLFMAVMIGIGATMGPGIFALTIRAYFLPEASIALLTLLTTVVFTAVNFMGMKEAIIVITVMNLVELAVLVGVAALGFTDIEPRNLEPLAPMGWGPFVPALESRSFVLGGVLTLVGSAIYLFNSENRAEVTKLAKFYLKSLKLFFYKLRRMRMRVLIISGEKQGQNIADRLLAKEEYQMMFRSAEHQVTFIEEDEALCKELEQRYNVPIYQGDGTKNKV